MVIVVCVCVCACACVMPLCMCAGGGAQVIFPGLCSGSTMLPWRLHPVQQSTQMAASLSLSLSLKQSSVCLIPDQPNQKKLVPAQVYKSPPGTDQALDSA